MPAPFTLMKMQIRNYIFVTDYCTGREASVVVVVCRAEASGMANVIGLLKVRVRRGINLAVRDTKSSDPYVVVSLSDLQKVKTSVVKNNCNPVWNEELTLSIKDPSIPVKLTVYDKDTLTVDDRMGEAEIDIGPYLECLKEHYEGFPDGTTILRVQPCRSNCLSDESRVIWVKGKMVQQMCLRLKHVESGEVEVELDWIDLTEAGAI